MIPDELYLLLAPALILAVVFMILFFYQLKQRRYIRAGNNAVICTLFSLISALFISLGLNLYTYQRLTYEQNLAQVVIFETAPRAFILRIEFHDSGLVENYPIRGDDWQIDARVLKWHGYANLLGFDSHYRFERLSGRYRDIEEERQSPRSLYQLADEPGLNLWNTIDIYGHWMPFVDAVFGSAAYVPLANKAEYSVSLGQSGILVRPTNEQAKKAIQLWHVNDS